MCNAVKKYGQNAILGTIFGEGASDWMMIE